jgi:catechol 2,3-dioxygenase-like lactoylglutathione lyase family enzyme
MTGARGVPDSGGFTLDHVEFFVPDRAEAAAWYARVLECVPVPGTERWAAHPDGPLMVSPDGGRTKLAIFAGAPQGDRETAGFHRVAFRLGASDWAGFAARISELGLEEDGRSGAGSGPHRRPVGLFHRSLRPPARSHHLRSLIGASTLLDRDLAPYRRHEDTMKRQASRFAP